MHVYLTYDKVIPGLVSTKGLTFRTGNEEKTMVSVGPMTRYVEDITPCLRLLLGENVGKLKLDTEVSLDWPVVGQIPG